MKVPVEELEFEAFRSSGPGGQNVNKVETAVRLRWNVASSPTVDPAVRARLAKLAGRRLTKEGVLLLEGRRFRTQEKNRADVLERLADLLERAERAPRVRRPSKPGRRAKERRLQEKRVRSETKRGRGQRGDAE